MALTKRSRTNSKDFKPYPEEWIVSFEYTANGRNIVPGTELSFKNQRGRYKFIKHVINGDKEWLDVRSDEKNGYCYCSFSVESIRRVHYKKKGRPRMPKA